MGEETYTVRGNGSPATFTRAGLKATLDMVGPLGDDYIAHWMQVDLLNYADFVGACRHFGLEHCLMLITYDEIKAEIAARKARGAKPRKLTKDTETMTWDMDRDEAEARLDIYERRVADAEAKMAAGADRKEVVASARSADHAKWSHRAVHGTVFQHVLYPTPGEETYTAHVAGEPQKYTRDELENFLGMAGPLGTDYIRRHMDWLSSHPDNFVDACRHFGLEHRLMDITDEEIKAEIATQRARGAKPRDLTRDMEIIMWDLERDEVDARIEIYRRRVAEAEARKADDAA